MRIVGAVLVVVGVVLLLGLRSAGRSPRAAAVWTLGNRAKAGLAGVVVIVAGVLLLLGGVQ